jgi:hypothetical protein
MLSKNSLQFLEDLKNHITIVIIFDNKKDMKFSKDYNQLVAFDFLDAMKPLDPSLEMLEVKLYFQELIGTFGFKTNLLINPILAFGSSGTKKVKVERDIMFI